MAIMTRTILAVVADMFFAAKIRAAAEALGVTLSFFRQLDALMNAAVERKPDLIIVDLHNEKLDPMELARALKANESSKQTPLLGFFSHVQTDLQRAAVEAGYDQVMPRSVFSRDLKTILGQDGLAQKVEATVDEDLSEHDLR
jgi:PleD family two-component response regulator